MPYGSKIFYGFLLCCVLGVIVASYIIPGFAHFEFWVFIVAFICLLSALLIFLYFSKKEYSNIEFGKKYKQQVLVLIFLSGMFFGVWRYFSIIDSDRGGNEYLDQVVEIDGAIVSEVVPSVKNQKFEVGKLEIDSNEEEGEIMVYANPFPELFYGDNLVFVCRLQAPEKIDDFDYPAYLARQGIFSICYYPEIYDIKRGEKNLQFYIFQIKKTLSENFLFGLKEPASGIARAMLLGEKHALDSEVREDFSRVGLSHIIAISGLHITIWGAVIFFLLIQLGLGRKSNFFASASILFLYLMLINFPASAVRAYLMLLIFALAFLSGRQAHLDRVLLLAAFLILLFSPRSIEDLGFQLSFLAVLGIAKFFWPIKRILTFRKFPFLKSAEDILSVTLSVQILTAPILVYNFGFISVIAPIANLLVIWCLPFLIIFSFLGVVLTIIFSSLAAFWFLPAQIFFDYIIWVSGVLADLPFVVLG